MCLFLVPAIIGNLILDLGGFAPDFTHPVTEDELMSYYKAAGAVNLVTFSVLMAIAGHNRSQMQTKCGVPDQGALNYVLNSPLFIFCFFIPLLQCQVSAQFLWWQAVPLTRSPPPPPRKRAP